MNYFLYASMAKLRFTFGLRSLGLAWLGIRVACKPNAETRVMADRSNFWKMANTAGKKKGRSMNPLIQLNRQLQYLFIALLLGCFAITQSAIAVTPEPDGGYPNGNTGEEDNALLDLNTGTDTPTASFPLKKSANNRYLTRQDGTPFLLIGDSAWMAVSQATNADIDTYLANRAAKGFNTILTQTIDSFFADNAPNNIDGVAPFTVPNNFSTANPAYYTRFDYLLDRAATYGMVVVTFPLYMGYQCENINPVGWAKEMIAAPTADLQYFGTWLGNRYKNKGNIIWVMAGDVSPFYCALHSKLNAFATALAAADLNHLITEHNARISEAVTPWLAGGVPSWLTLNSTYPDNLTFGLSQTAYNRTPIRPFFVSEARYENSGVTRKDLRSEAYWSILSGNCGYMFGNCPLFGFGSQYVHDNFCIGQPTDWRQQLNSTGSQDMTRFKNVFTSVALQRLVPDFTHTTVTAGFGTGTTTVTTGRASDGSFVMSYLPSLNRVTVNMTRLTGSSVAARWYDPTNGTYSIVSGSPFPNTGTRVFTPTRNNSSGASDWVLLLQSSTP